MASGLAARNGGRAGLAALVAILLLGLGLRLGEAWDGRAPVYDARAYAAIAANLEGGTGFTVGPGATQPSSNYSPGLPLFVSGLYEVTGGVHERLARVVLAVVGTLSVLFAYLIGRRLTTLVAAGRTQFWAALAGALAVAVFPALLEYQGMLMGEPLAATLLSGAVLAILWAREREGAVPWLLPGALLGALTLTRPEYLAVSVLLAVIAALPLTNPLQFVTQRVTKGRAPACGHGAGRWSPGLVRTGALLAGLVLVLAPWTIRNAVALDRFVPVSTGGGQVLFAGTYLPSDGDPERVGEEVVARHPELFGPNATQNLRLEQILARLAAHRFPGMETDQALSKMGKEQLWDEISEEPLEYLGFLATKVGRVWFHPARDVMRAPAWRVLQWALVLLGALGLALLAWRRRWEALLLGTIILAITAISALLVASPRRMLVLLPLVAALAGVGVAWGAATARRAPGQPAAVSPSCR